MSKLDELIAELCPDGVEYKRLSEVAPYVRGKGLSKSDIGTGDNSIVLYGELYTTYGNYIRAIKSQASDDAVASSQLVEKNSVLLPISSTTKEAQIGKASVLKIDHVYLGGDAVALQPTYRVNADFIMYCVNSGAFELRKMKCVKGTTIQHLSPDGLSDIEIPVPPLPIQEEIVRILDKFTALTAELQAELQARRKQYEFYRDRLLTFGEDVEWKPLGKIANTFRGEYITKQSTQTGEIPVILGGQEPAYYIDKSNHSGELITVARSGASAGFVAYWDEPIFLTDGFGYEAKPNIIKFKYLYYILKNRETELNAMKRGAGVPHVSGEALGKLKFPVPPLSEQERIVSILDRFDALCNDITSGLPAEIEARQKQYEYYRDKLLTFTPKR